MSRKTTKIVAIVLLLCFLPATVAILLAIFSHPLFLLLLLVMLFAIPFFRAVQG